MYETTAGNVYNIKYIWCEYSVWNYVALNWIK
jgi:hypothetical protein